VAGEAHCGTQVAMTTAALPARATRDRRVDCHGSPCIGALVDHSGDLVAQYQGSTQLGVPNATFLEPVQIRPAEPDVGHPNQSLVGARDRSVLVTEAQVSRSV
jgi:hypothetical protein